MCTDIAYHNQCPFDNSARSPLAYRVVMFFDRPSVDVPYGSLCGSYKCHGLASMDAPGPLSSGVPLLGLFAQRFDCGLDLSCLFPGSL